MYRFIRIVIEVYFKFIADVIGIEKLVQNGMYINKGISLD